MQPLSISVDTYDSLSLDQRKKVVVESVRDYANDYTLRQISSIFSMSMAYLTDLAQENGFVFLDRESEDFKRKSSEEIALHREHKRAVVQRGFSKSTLGAIDPDKISEKMKERSLRREFEETSEFINRLRELGKTHTSHAAAKAVNISNIFINTLAIEHEISFVGSPAGDKPNRRVCHKPRLFNPDCEIVSSDTVKVMSEYILRTTLDDDF